jgi:hypothetical protein
MNTKEFHALISVLNNIVLEIRALPDKDLSDARLMANVIHKLPAMLGSWGEVEFEDAVRDLRKRMLHHPETEYLTRYLPRQAGHDIIPP